MELISTCLTYGTNKIKYTTEHNLQFHNPNNFVPYIGVTWIMVIIRYYCAKFESTLNWDCSAPLLLTIITLMLGALVLCKRAAHIMHYVSSGDEFSFRVWGHKALTIWLALCGQATATINNGRVLKKAERISWEMHTSQLTSKSQITRRDCWAGRIVWDTREELREKVLCVMNHDLVCAPDILIIRVRTRDYFVVHAPGNHRQ